MDPNKGPIRESAHTFDQKYFDQFSSATTEDQRFKEKVYAPYGLHETLPITGPPDMYQIWPYEPSELGEEWNKTAPPIESGGLYAYQMPYLKSEFIKDVQWIKVLGQGGYGIVWEVIAQYRASTRYQWPDQFEKFKFACKVLRPRLATIRFEGRRKMIEDTLNDMRILRYLKHVNICNICDIIGIPDRNTGFPYAVVCIFFQLCDGTLHDIVEQGRSTFTHANEWSLPEDLSRHWFRHTLRGLDYIHSNGIIHRDIKRRNILYLCKPPIPLFYRERFMKCTFKLADFGVSKTESDFKEEERDYFKADQLMDVKDLFDIVLGYAVLNSMKDPHNLFTYCKTHRWKKGYPDQWKNISRDLQAMVILVKSPESKVTAMDLLNHPWLQNINYRRSSSTPRGLHEIFETFGEDPSAEFLGWE